MTWYVDGYTDGKNPSDTGGGFVVFKDDKHFITQHIDKNNFTNNEAELLGVLFCSGIADDNDTIFTDSMNTIYWVKSGKPKARPDLKEIVNMAKSMVSKKHLQIKFIKREQNLAGNYIENSCKKLESMGL